MHVTPDVIYTLSKLLIEIEATYAFDVDLRDHVRNGLLRAVNLQAKNAVTNEEIPCLSEGERIELDKDETKYRISVIRQVRARYGHDKMGLAEARDLVDNYLKERKL